MLNKTVFIFHEKNCGNICEEECYEELEDFTMRLKEQNVGLKIDGREETLESFRKNSNQTTLDNLKEAYGEYATNYQTIEEVDFADFNIPDGIVVNPTCKKYGKKTQDTIYGYKIVVRFTLLAMDENLEGAVFISAVPTENFKEGMASH